jgi:hypothetical protein
MYKSPVGAEGDIMPNALDLVPCRCSLVTSRFVVKGAKHNIVTSLACLNNPGNVTAHPNFECGKGVEYRWLTMCGWFLSWKGVVCAAYKYGGHFRLISELHGRYS